MARATLQAQAESLEIRVLSACLTGVVLVLAFKLDVSRDVFAADQVRFTLSAMLLASAWSGPLTVVAGFFAFPDRWRALQPFSGGGGFVVLQAVGWMLYALSIFTILVALANASAMSSMDVPRGAFTSLGAFAAASQLTLNGSLSLYDSEADSLSSSSSSRQPKEEETERRRRRRGTTKSGPLTALSLLLAIAGTLLYFAADETVRENASQWFSPSIAEWFRMVGTAAAPVLVACAAASHGLASIATHVVHGRVAKGANYRAWMPFEGGSRFILLQALAWTLFGIESDVLLAVSARQLSKVAGLPIALGICGLVANIVLIAALDQFTPSAHASGAPTIPTTNAFFLRGGPERVTAWLFLAFSILGFAFGASIRWSSFASAPAAYVMATVLAHLAPPLAHAGGARTVRGYSLFMVGQGGPSFVIAQGCGWMLYSLSVLASAITAANPSVWNHPSEKHNNSLLRFAAPLAVLSSTVLVASVDLFGAEDTGFFREFETPTSTTNILASARNASSSGLSDDADATSTPLHVPTAVAESATEYLWRVRCEVVLPPGQNRGRRMTRKQERQRIAGQALAANKACDELSRLRCVAKVPGVILLLEQAENALRATTELKGDGSAIFHHDDDDTDDDEEERRRAHLVSMLVVKANDRSENEGPATPISSTLPSECQWKRLVLSRDLDATLSPFSSLENTMTFAGDTASLFAAPLASLAGIALFALAEKSGKLLSPSLALCAFTSTLASVPLQFHLEARFLANEECTHLRRRFVALRLVALAAWSFAVLVALAALLRYTMGDRCALAVSIGQSVGESVRSPLGACGWGSAAMQVAVLVCSPPADSLDAAVGIISRRRALEKSLPASSILRRWSVLQGGGRGRSSSSKLLSLLPDDAWRFVEDHLTATDLVMLSGAAKNIPWCATYNRPARWRRLFASRTDVTFVQKLNSLRNRLRRESLPDLQTDAIEFPIFRDDHVSSPRTGLVALISDTVSSTWHRLHAALSPSETLLALERAFDPSFMWRPGSHRPPVTHRYEFRRRVHAVLATRSRACAWKLACVLHERGAPLVRCAICGEVDLGDATNEFITPCLDCGMASCAHRQCLERELGLTGSGRKWSSFNRPMRYQELTCRSCGRELDSSLRSPRGPLELASILLDDYRTVAVVTATLIFKCVTTVTVTLALHNACYHREWNINLKGAGPRRVFIWYLCQEVMLLEILFSQRFSSAVDRLWSLTTRNGVRLYLRLYSFFVVTSFFLGIVFSPISTYFVSPDGDHDHNSLGLGGAAMVILKCFAWIAAVLYAIVSSACVCLFVLTNYSVLTVADYT